MVSQTMPATGCRLVIPSTTIFFLTLTPSPPPVRRRATAPASSCAAASARRASACTSRRARSARRGFPAPPARRDPASRSDRRDESVERRCAIMKVVRPIISSSSASRMMASVFESIDDVGSSRMRIGASLRNARATQMRWRSPPDSRTPRSPMSVWYPSASRSMKSWALAALAALDDLVHRRLQAAVADVVGDRPGEQDRFLRHHADLPAQRIEAQRPHVAARRAARVRAADRRSAG